ncbi:hypothetical protein BDW02DRAFT_574299, partial [Decorospora gaudefroyi]
MSPAGSAHLVDVPPMRTNPTGDGDAHVGATLDVQDFSESVTSTNSSISALEVSRTVTYSSTGVQTMPPKNSNEFRIIYGHDPSEPDIVSRMGSAAIGRFVAGRAANHEAGYAEPWSPTTELCVNPGVAYDHTGFQTVAVAECKMSLARARVKASMLANKQRRAAEEAGYRIWPETTDEKIIHSEQFPVHVQFDSEGNATSGNVGGLLLPNIAGEEINPTTPASSILQVQHRSPPRKVSYSKHVDPHVLTSTSGLTPPPTPPPAPLSEADRDKLHLRRIHSLVPSVPKESSDPLSLEDYGYVRRVPQKVSKNDLEDATMKDATENPKNSEIDTEEDTEGLEVVLEIGGERFADKYIVYDATGSDPATPDQAPTLQPCASKKRKIDSLADFQDRRSCAKRSRICNSAAVADMTAIEVVRWNEHTELGESHRAKLDVKKPHEESYKETESVKAIARTSRRRVRTGSVHSERERQPAPDTNNRSHRTPRQKNQSPDNEYRSSSYRLRSTTRRADDSHCSDERGFHTEIRKLEHERRNLRRSKSPHVLEKTLERFLTRDEHKKRDRVAKPEKAPMSQARAEHREILSSKASAKERREEEQKAQRKREEQDIKRARGHEKRLRREHHEREEARKAEELRQQDEAEQRRAEEIQYHRRQEMEEKRQARETEERLRQDALDQDRRRREQRDQHRRVEEHHERVRRRRRERSLEMKKDSKGYKPEAPVDEYALARETENRRRELASQMEVMPTRRGRERSVEGRSNRGAERRKPEKKTEDKKISKARHTRTPRVDLQRYNPRKKFG